jgi:hypothetical protein
MELQGFGYKNAWMAARGADPAALAAALSLEIAGPCEWDRGIAAAYDYDSRQLFITPPIDGWVLCVGRPLLDDVVSELTARVARELGTEVQLFATHRVVEAHAWARATPQGLVRAFSWDGESGEVLLDIGEHSEDECVDSPDEEDVMHLAGRWSIDPASLDGRSVEVSEGLLCRERRAEWAAVEKAKPWWKLW